MKHYHDAIDRLNAAESALARHYATPWHLRDKRHNRATRVLKNAIAVQREKVARMLGGFAR